MKWSADDNAVFQMFFGLDQRYFNGVSVLGLQSDGEAIFGTAVTPSDKVRYNGRGQMLQVTGFCKKLSETIKGRWSMKGNDIFINGQKVATISKDGKTAIHDSTIMKITQKL